MPDSVGTYPIVGPEFRTHPRSSRVVVLIHTPDLHARTAVVVPDVIIHLRTISLSRGFYQFMSGEREGRESLFELATALVLVLREACLYLLWENARVCSGRRRCNRDRWTPCTRPLRSRTRPLPRARSCCLRRARILRILVINVAKGNDLFTGLASNASLLAYVGGGRATWAVVRRATRSSLMSLLRRNKRAPMPWWWNVLSEAIDSSSAGVKGLWNLC